MVLGLPALLVLGKPAWMPLTWALAAAVPVALACAAWADYFWRRRPGAPFVPVTISFYGISFGLTVFLAGFHKHYDSEYVVYRYVFDGPGTMLDERALFLAAGGVLMLALALAVGQRLFRGSGLYWRLPAAYSPRRVEALAWLLIAGHLAYFLIPGISNLSSVGQVLQPGGYVGFAVLYALWCDGRLPRWQAVALFAAVIPAIMVVRLSIGTLTPLVYFFLVAFLVATRATSRLPWKSLAVGALAVVLIYPVIGAYRSLTWGALMRVEQVSDRGMSSFVQATAGQYRDIAREGMLGLGGHLLEVFTSRAGQVPILSQAARIIPAEYPYLQGETYRPLLTAMIPRVLYPNKPEERFGTEFARRYGFTWQQDPTTINVPWLTELYINFGPGGVTMGMAVFGLVLALLDQLFNAGAMRREEAAVGVGILFPLAFQESNFSLMTGSVPLLALTLLAYFWLGLRVGAVRSRGVPTP
jgi:hypothetical protein